MFWWLRFRPCAQQPGWYSLPIPIRPCGLPSARIPPDRDLAGGTSCTISLRFSSLKIVPGEILSSADKWAVNTTRTVELLCRKACNRLPCPPPPSRNRKNSQFFNGCQVLVCTKLLNFTARFYKTSRFRLSIQKSAGGVRRLRGGS